MVRGGERRQCPAVVLRRRRPQLSPGRQRRASPPPRTEHPASAQRHCAIAVCFHLPSDPADGFPPPAGIPCCGAPPAACPLCSTFATSTGQPRTKSQFTCWIKNMDNLQNGAERRRRASVERAVAGGRGPTTLLEVGSFGSPLSTLMNLKGAVGCLPAVSGAPVRTARGVVRRQQSVTAAARAWGSRARGPPRAPCARSPRSCSTRG